VSFQDGGGEEIGIYCAEATASSGSLVSGKDSLAAEPLRLCTQAGLGGLFGGDDAGEEAAGGAAVTHGGFLSDVVATS